ncbi:MAG: hypothetical protein FWB90_10275 [Fibromonadales bacterium]|nr:hypothetical protein [Fibromonadales bacterium]
MWRNLGKFEILLLLATSAFAQKFSLEAGANYFLGDLQKEIHLSPYGGVGFEYKLSELHFGYMQGSYSYLFLKKNEDFHGLHQFVGRAGVGFLEYFGVGVSLAGVRGRDKTPQAENYMLATSESEFGWNFRFKICCVVLYYDIIWTAPKNSHLLQLGASFSL